MKDTLITLWILILLLLWIYFFSNLREKYDKDVALENRQIVTVKKVVDWDTINVLLSWEIASVRLIWVDTPEKTTTRYWYTQCYGQEATDYLSWLLLRWSKIELEYDDSQWLYDKHDRILAYVLQSWVNINELIIKNWYWWEYTYNLSYRYQSEFIDAENFAIKNNLWLWNYCIEEYSKQWEANSVLEKLWIAIEQLSD
jgi:endonuclease YncB( thermonuclease family)